MHICLGVFLLLGLIYGSQGKVGAPCTNKSDCADDECCQIINIIVVSKKRQLTTPPGSGTCMPLKQHGAQCSGIDIMNGYCDCAQGLDCRMVQTSTPPPSGTRIRRTGPPPGYDFLCLP